MYVGATALTRTPRSAHSAARDRVRWCTPAFEALYWHCSCGRFHDVAGHRSHVHDRALPSLEHPPAERATAIEDTVEVHGQDRAPLLVRHLLGRHFADRNTGIVHEHVHAAVAALELRCDTIDVVRGGYVQRQPLCGDTAVPQPTGRRFGACRVEVENGDGGARLAQR